MSGLRICKRNSFKKTSQLCIIDKKCNSTFICTNKPEIRSWMEMKLSHG